MGPVFSNESTEQAPSLDHVVSLLRREEDGGSTCVGSGGGSVASPEVKPEW